MSNDRLGAGREYVERLRRRGRSDAQISKGLEAAGWSEAQIARLMRTQEEARLPDEHEEPTPSPTTGAPPQRPVGLSIAMGLVAVIAAAGTGLVIWAFLQARGQYLNEFDMMGVFIMLVVGLICVPALVLSIFVWRGQNWARILMMLLMGIVALVVIPISTVIALPILWVLSTQETRDFCSGRSKAEPTSPKRSLGLGRRCPSELEIVLAVISVGAMLGFLPALGYVVAAASGPLPETDSRMSWFFCSWLIYAAVLVVAYMLWRRRAWARIAMTALRALVVIFPLVAFAAGDSHLGSAIWLIAVAGAFIVVLNTRNVRHWCTQ